MLYYLLNFYFYHIIDCFIDLLIVLYTFHLNKIEYLIVDPKKQEFLEEMY